VVLAENLRQEIARMRVDGVADGFSASIGIAVMPDDATNAGGADASGGPGAVRRQGCGPRPGHGRRSTALDSGALPDERFSEHLNHPVGRGTRSRTAMPETAGGSICGDLVRIGVRVEGAFVADAGFEASGCGALTAAASACVELVRGAPMLDAARVGSADVAAELGGLSAGKLHAADLAADALARALGAAAVAQAEVEPVLRPRSGGDERRRRQRRRKRCSAKAPSPP